MMATCIDTDEAVSVGVSMHLRLIAVTLGAALTLASPAAAANYRVTGLADGAGVACGPAGADGFKTCPTLRQAITEANADADDTKVVLLGVSGTYTLTQGPLQPQTDIALLGLGARSTTIAGSADRVLSVPSGASVVLSSLAIEGGQAPSGDPDGGNILNEGELSMVQVRISGGSAAGYGGAIANRGGQLYVSQSLIATNSADNGGGISNDDGTFTVTDSTLTGNSAPYFGGSAIYTNGDGTINQSTLNANGDGATLLSTGTAVSVYGSLFANPGSSGNCAGTPPASEGFNLDSGTTCGFADGDSNVDPQLSAQLVNRGGGTDVFELGPTSPALNLVSPCGSPLDQRGFQRSPDAQSPLAPCDAGAYDHDAVAIVTQPPPPPPPEPTPVPTPAPTPVPTPAPTATPRTNRSVAATETKGTVLVKLRGTKRFVPLSAAVIGNGTEVDARKGTVELTTAAGETARFSQGRFKVAQVRGVTTLTLSEKLSCPKPRRAHAAAKKVKRRKLFGDGKGRFQTRGQFGAATVRGTKWLTTDTCTTTTVKVTQGAVTFRDLVKRRTVVVRKGKSATARK